MLFVLCDKELIYVWLTFYLYLLVLGINDNLVLFFKFILTKTLPTSGWVEITTSWSITLVILTVITKEMHFEEIYILFEFSNNVWYRYCILEITFF